MTIPWLSSWDVCCWQVHHWSLCWQQKNLVKLDHFPDLRGNQTLEGAVHSTPQKKMRSYSWWQLTSWYGSLSSAVDLQFTGVLSTNLSTDSLGFLKLPDGQKRNLFAEKIRANLSQCFSLKLENPWENTTQPDLKILFRHLVGETCDKQGPGLVILRIFFWELPWDVPNLCKRKKSSHLEITGLGCKKKVQRSWVTLVLWKPKL